MTLPTPDSLSRTKKLFVDSGEARSFAEADALLRSFVLQVHVGHLAGNATLQAAALTIVNSAIRAFEGGVRVLIEGDCPVIAGWHRGERLSAALVSCGGSPVDELVCDHPTVCIGEAAGHVRGTPVLRAVADGWTAGVVEGSAAPFMEHDTFVAAGVVAGGIAVAEAFEFRRGTNPYAGRRAQGLSLWRPGEDWLITDAVGPDDVTYGPAEWWIVGLGHLGQGYLWSVGMLRYADPRDVHVLLQDDDVITGANESTGLLLAPGATTVRGLRKTRVLASLLEAHGFRTTITERRLRPGDGPIGREPRLALIGVDNPETRRELSSSEDTFGLIIDVGLGDGPRHYQDVQLHTFPGPRRSQEVPGWRDAREHNADVREMPAYVQAAEEDECGVVEIAGRSVAASFVGATAGALAVAEAMRALRGDDRHSLVSASLRDLHELDAVVADTPRVANMGFALLQ